MILCLVCGAVSPLGGAVAPSHVLAAATPAADQVEEQAFNRRVPLTLM